MMAMSKHTSISTIIQLMKCSEMFSELHVLVVGQQYPFHFFYSLVLMPMIANSDRDLQAVLNSLTSTLIHRQSLLLYNIENIFEDFEEEMFTLRTNSFSPIRTSIVGQIMEETYNTANLEYGMFSCAASTVSFFELRPYTLFRNGQPPSPKNKNFVRFPLTDLVQQSSPTL